MTHRRISGSREDEWINVVPTVDGHGNLDGNALIEAVRTGTFAIDGNVTAVHLDKAGVERLRAALPSDIASGRRKAPPTIEEVRECAWWWVFPPEADEFLEVVVGLEVKGYTRPAVFYATDGAGWHAGEPFEPSEWNDHEWAPCIMPGPAEGGP